MGIKATSIDISDDYFEEDEDYILEAKIDYDTPVPICDIKKNDFEESEYKFLNFLHGSENILFGLRNLKTKKQVGVAKIDLKRLYD